MPARVNVRAVIWVGEKIVVHKVARIGELHVTLPGGRVNERESVVDAVRREVLEEIGFEVSVGDLMFAAEVFSGARHQNVELVFAAEPVTPIFGAPVELVDPRESNPSVLPPVLTHIAAWRDGTLKFRWVGNIYTSQPLPPSPAPDA